MPQPRTGSGPWGEAIRYWLRAKDMRQADLVRAVHEANPQETITANTISNASRGLHCSTRTLEQIALALKVPLDTVLVSPDRTSAQEARRLMVQEVTEHVVRTIDAHLTPAKTPATLEQQTDALAAAVLKEQERINRAKQISRQSLQRKAKTRQRVKK